MNISVCICTKNRPKDLYQFLLSLKKSSYLPYEVIVVDQSNEENAIINQKLCHENNVRYYRHKNGASRGKNLAIALSTGNILVFTDDDCIPDNNWLKSIADYFGNNPNISGVFGQTKPYQPNLHQHRICPSVFISNKPYVAVSPHIDHFLVLGNGNNMSFRKTIFESVGLFNTWFGPGSVCRGADEGELIYRLLSQGHKLAFNPKTVVYHNRWLTETDYNSLLLKYNSGDIAFSVYWGIKAHDWCLIKRAVDYTKCILINSIKNQPFIKSVNIRVAWTVKSVYTVVKGLLVGLIIVFFCRIPRLKSFNHESKI
jgi:GT2 family glycosyltransferase